MPDYKRPLVLAELREHLIPEIFDRTFEFSGDGETFSESVNPLTRIMIHVEQATLVPQTKTLIPSSDPTLPTGNQSRGFHEFDFPDSNGFKLFPSSGFAGLDERPAKSVKVGKDHAPKRSH